jgi:hypothetical protein
MDETNVFFANVIRLFHYLLVLFMVVIPFIGQAPMLILHITFAVSIIVHWLGNSDVCALTLLECQLRGVPKTKSFMHQLISPVYTVPPKTVTNALYIALTVLGMISLRRLLKTTQWRNFKACLMEIRQTDSLTLKIKNFVLCLRELFEYDVQKCSSI